MKLHEEQMICMIFMFLFLPDLDLPSECPTPDLCFSRT